MKDNGEYILHKYVYTYILYLQFIRVKILRHVHKYA